MDLIPRRIGAATTPPAAHDVRLNALIETLDLPLAAGADRIRPLTRLLPRILKGDHRAGVTDFLLHQPGLQLIPNPHHRGALHCLQTG